MTTYVVYYYKNRQPNRYMFVFESLFGAVFKARSIFEEHGYATDVMDTKTGEIVAIFEPDNEWIADNADADSKTLAITPIV